MAQKHILTVRFDATDHEALQLVAAADEQPIGVWIRKTVRAAVRRRLARLTTPALLALEQQAPTQGSD